MPTARPMMPSSDRLVSNTRRSPKAVLQPQRGGVHAALGTDVLAEEQHLGIGGELVLQRPPDRGEQVDASGPSGSALPRCTAGIGVRPGPVRPGAAARAAVGPISAYTVPGHAGGSGSGRASAASEGRRRTSALTCASTAAISVSAQHARPQERDTAWAADRRPAPAPAAPASCTPGCPAPNGR